MDYFDREVPTNSMIEAILNNLGTEFDAEAKKKYAIDDMDNITYLYSYVPVKGLKYNFDGLRLEGYYYNDEFYCSVSYGYTTIIEDNYRKNFSGDFKWRKLLKEIYNSIDILKKNQEAEKDFFNQYGKYLPWPEKVSLGSCEETRKRHIEDIDITMIVEVYFNWINSELSEEAFNYYIYDGKTCVYDSKANFFIDGPWKDRLIEYMNKERKSNEKAKVLKKELELNNSLNKLNSIINNSNK